MSEWRDLSEGELRAKLKHRGISQQSIDFVVLRREDTGVARIIDRMVKR